MISIFEDERDGAPDTEKESFIEQQKSAPILLDQSLLFSNESQKLQGRMHSDNVVGLTKKKPAASPRGRVSARRLRMSRNGRTPRRGSHHSWLDEQEEQDE